MSSIALVDGGAMIVVGLVGGTSPDRNHASSSGGRTVADKPCAVQADLAERRVTGRRAASVAGLGVRPAFRRRWR